MMNRCGASVRWDAIVGIRSFGVTLKMFAMTLIKAQFRRLDRVHHPNCGGDPQNFMRIQAAYEQAISAMKKPVKDERRSRLGRTPSCQGETSGPQRTSTSPP